MTLATVLIIIMIILLLGSGGWGWYYHGWAVGFSPFTALVLFLVILYLLGYIHR